MPGLEEAIAFLQTDPFKYIVHLKLLAAHPERVLWRMAGRGAQTGLSLCFPCADIPYDAKTYPGAQWVVLLAGTDPEVLARLVEQLPRDQTLVFKLVDAPSRAAVLARFPARRVSAFLSFTTSNRSYALDPAVVVNSTLDARLLPCFESNGYTLDEMEGYFRRGALSFGLFGPEPLAACFVFPNFGAIWEVGGVYTAPAYRRQGLAGRVVAGALHNLLELGKTPRYQVVETNQASLALAESLGLAHFVTTEHFLSG